MRVERELQHNLTRFHTWCTSNKLSLNPSKTKVVIFGTRQSVKKNKNFNVKINGTKIKVVPTYKYLGVMLDSTLTYKAHIAYVSRIILHKIAVLSAVRKYLTKDVAIKVYKSMVLPYFDYGDVIYHTAGKGDLEKLQRLQNRCLKICLRTDMRQDTLRVHSLTSSNLLKERREAHVCNFMYKRKERATLLDDRPNQY